MAEKNITLWAIGLGLILIISGCSNDDAVDDLNSILETNDFNDSVENDEFDDANITNPPKNTPLENQSPDEEITQEIDGNNSDSTPSEPSQEDEINEEINTGLLDEGDDIHLGSMI